MDFGSCFIASASVVKMVVAEVSPPLVVVFIVDTKLSVEFSVILFMIQDCCIIQSRL
jgi:hypothetical protein